MLDWTVTGLDQVTGKWQVCAHMVQPEVRLHLLERSHLTSAAAFALLQAEHYDVSICTEECESTNHPADADRQCSNPV